MALTQNDKNRIAADQLYQTAVIHGLAAESDWAGIEDINLDQHPAALDLLEDIKNLVKSNTEVAEQATHSLSADEWLATAFELGDYAALETLRDWHRRHATAILETLQEMSNQ